MPATAALQKLTDDRLTLEGEVTFESAPDLLKQGLAFLSQSSSNTITIDLASMTSGGSVAIALLLAWLRQARALHKTLTYDNLSKQLQHIASASNLETILCRHSGPGDRHSVS